MSEQKTILDTDELLHLALHATNNNQPEKGIAYLKKCVEIDPKHSKAYYLLGALHAEIGMYDRAIDEMSKAVELEPELHTAHFQLGLLYITSGNVEAAEKAWQPLDELGEENALFLFKRGMLHLASDEFEACIADINKGMPLNNFNPNLNNDMQRILVSAEEALNHNKQNAAAAKSEANDSKKEETDSGKKGKGGKRALLSAYKQNDD